MSSSETGMHPSGAFCVTTFGAKGDGRTFDTAAIQDAIAACASRGGGVVALPPGTYLSGALRLRSHVTLRLEAGATLLASPNRNDYHLDGGLGGFLVAIDEDNVAVEGPGTIDGNGRAFIDKDVGHPEGPVAMKLRPGNLISFSNGARPRLSGFAIKDAPFWTIHYDGCRDGVIEDLVIDNDPIIPNNDGIHCACCQGVRISGCRITAGDDAIAVTGIDDHQEIIPGFIGYQRPCEDIVISDCVLSSRSAGIRFGYGQNDVRRCAVSNVVIRETNRGVGVFVRQSGSVRDISVSNAVIETRFMRGPWWGKGEPIHVSAAPWREEDTLGRIEGVAFTGVQARSESGVLVRGLEDRPIHGLALADSRIEVVPSAFEDQDDARHGMNPAGMGVEPEWRAPVQPLDMRGVTGARLQGVELVDRRSEPA